MRRCLRWLPRVTGSRERGGARTWGFLRFGGNAFLETYGVLERVFDLKKNFFFGSNEVVSKKAARTVSTRQ